MKTSFNVFPLLLIFILTPSQKRNICNKLCITWHRYGINSTKTSIHWNMQPIKQKNQKDKYSYYITGILSFIALRYIWNIWIQPSVRYIEWTLHTINQHWWHEWPGGQKFFSKYNNILASISLYTVAQLCTQADFLCCYH